MTGLAKGLATALTVVIVLTLACVLFFERVLPTDIGVRQSLWGGGISEEDFKTGTYLGIAGVHKWHYLPRRTHFLHFTGRSSGRGTQPPGLSEHGLPTTMWNSPMELRTKDGNLTTIDITVPYRIIDGGGWRIVSDGIMTDYTENVKSKVESVLRSKLSKLTSEDLQSTEKRLNRANEVLVDLNKTLAEFYVQADAILIRRVAFPEQYEEKLQETQYYSQKEKLDTALTAQADEEKVTNSIEKQIEAEIKSTDAEWNKILQEESSRFEVMIAEVQANAKVYESRVRAEGEAEAITQEAEGQLAVDQAEALRNQLRNEILNSKGGSIFLALEAAENLNMRQVMLNSNDPRVPLVIDLDEMARLLMTGSSP
ncbi:MAG: SPFH domain-containing protein [Planctomycetota bacterium]|jgi:regulator of protease activity HflC (stomatin/prohibitin superfamily)|nr:SPFH domain-containing protein [Planctomycetota bacterium]